MTKDTVFLTQEIKSAEENNVRIEYYTLDCSTQEIYMCPGDLICICNVLYDYAHIFEAFIQEAEEQGEEWRKYTYEYHLDRCRNIQEKIESVMGYSTEKAIEKCRKKQGKPMQDEDVGEDALVLLVRRMRKKQSKLNSEISEQDDFKSLNGQMELKDFIK